MRRHTREWHWQGTSLVMRFEPLTALLRHLERHYKSVALLRVARRATGVSCWNMWTDPGAQHLVNLLHDEAESSLLETWAWRYVSELRDADWYHSQVGASKPGVNTKNS